MPHLVAPVPRVVQVPSIETEDMPFLVYEIDSDSDS